VSIAPPPGLVPPGTRRLPAGRAAMFLRAGAGPTLLCIPGGYHGAWCFAAWLDAFAARGRAVAALEPRGRGTLAATADPATGIEDHAADTVEAARAIGGEVVLVGHSLGALVAMRAAERLGRVAGLVLAAPSPPGNLPGAAPVPLVPEGAMLPPPSRQVVSARYLGGASPPGLDAYHAALSPESPRVLNDRYALRIAIAPERLRTTRVLVIEAGHDDRERHPPGQDAAIAEFLWATHRLLPEAPHSLMLPPWAAASAATMEAWLRDAPGGQPPGPPAGRRPPPRPRVT
jgi:pimeloyl-ACP methyl ester carboxylesterase